MLEHDTFVREWMQKYPEATIDDAEDQFAQELVNSLAPLPSADYVVDRMTATEKDDLLRSALRCMSALGHGAQYTSPVEMLNNLASDLTLSAPKWVPSLTEGSEDDLRWWCDFGGHELPAWLVQEDPSLAAETAWNPEGYECDRCEAGTFPGHDCDDAQEGNVDPGTCSREKWCGAVRHDADCPVASFR